MQPELFAREPTKPQTRELLEHVAAARQSAQRVDAFTYIAHCVRELSTEDLRFDKSIQKEILTRMKLLAQDTKVEPENPIEAISAFVECYSKGSHIQHLNGAKIDANKRRLGQEYVAQARTLIEYLTDNPIRPSEFFPFTIDNSDVKEVYDIILQANNRLRAEQKLSAQQESILAWWTRELRENLEESVYEGNLVRVVSFKNNPQIRLTSELTHNDLQALVEQAMSAITDSTTTAKEEQEYFVQSSTKDVKEPEKAGTTFSIDYHAIQTHKFNVLDAIIRQRKSTQQPQRRYARRKAMQEKLYQQLATTP